MGVFSQRKLHTIKDNVEGKECSCCSIWKPLSAYGTSRRRWDGVRETCKECRKEATARDSEKRKQYFRDYHRRNKGKRNAWMRRYKRSEEFLARLKDRRSLEPKFRLSCCISSLVRYSLRRRKNGHHWENLVGYSLEDLMHRLEVLFQPGMSWDNYGKWHVDHILPIASFHFESFGDTEFKKCWALSNLQPLWAIDNCRKGARV